MNKIDRLIKKRAECVENLKKFKESTEYEIKLIDDAMLRTGDFLADVVKDVADTYVDNGWRICDTKITNNITRYSLRKDT